MKCIYSESVPGYGLPGCERVVILADEDPEVLELTGSDVEGLADGTIIAAGSLLISPNKNYIAFKDGVFAEKVAGSGGGGGGGGGDCNVFLVNAEPDADAEVGEGNPTPLITDKTYAEVIEARDNGLLVVFMCQYSGDDSPTPYILDGSSAYPIAVGAYLAASLHGFTDFGFDQIVYGEETGSFALKAKNPTFGSILHIVRETDSETADQRYIPISSYDEFSDAFSAAVETNYPVHAVVNDTATHEMRTVSLVTLQPINDQEDYCAVFQETAVWLDSGTCGTRYLIVTTDSANEVVTITEAEFT